jgi:3'-5' exoribonuclease
MVKLLSNHVSERQRAFLPDVFRLIAPPRQHDENGNISYVATIFHDPHRFDVVWTKPPSVNFNVGDLVKLDWDGWPMGEDGFLRIDGLVELRQPDPKVNLFWTVPDTWVSDTKLIEAGGELWETLPIGFRQLFNGIFWNAARFYNYLRGPSSRGHHHNRCHGNFAHSLEVATMARRIAEHSEHVDPHVLVMAGLLHDAAKAEEYELDCGSTCKGWTEEGSLLGHRIMVYGWIKTAIAAYWIDVPNRQLLALEHALLATKGIAIWSGFPEPRMLEACILAKTDRLSGSMDLFEQLAPKQDGFGRRHWTMKYAPYFSRRDKSGGERHGET